MSKGFTMIELMFVIAILVFVVAGLLVAYVNCLTLNEFNLKFSIAMNLARQAAELTHYYSSNWSAIVSQEYDEAYMSANHNVEGYSEAIIVDNSVDPSLKIITVVVCWRGKGGRIIGEDNGAGVSGNQLNGRRDSGEDANGDGRLSSPCEITFAIAKK